MPTYINAGSLSFTRPFSTLLRYNGTEYPGGTICNKVRIPQERSIPEVVERADNSISFSEMGKRVGRMGGFELDVFQESAVAAIGADIAREATEGIFLLERPGPAWDSSTPSRRYYIRFWDAPFEPATDARSFNRVRWHRADMTSTPIEVIRGEDI